MVTSTAAASGATTSQVRRAERSVNISSITIATAPTIAKPSARNRYP